MNLEKKELAGRLGVRSETCYRWESGDQSIGKIADHLVRVLVAMELGDTAYALKVADVAVDAPQKWYAEVEQNDERWESRVG